MTVDYQKLFVPGDDYSPAVVNNKTDDIAHQKTTANRHRRSSLQASIEELKNRALKKKSQSKSPTGRLQVPVSHMQFGGFEKKRNVLWKCKINEHYNTRRDDFVTVNEII